METELVRVDIPEGVNIIIGQSHFIKTVEDVYEAMVNAVPGIEFGIAFCEASGDRRIRYDGTDEDMQNAAIAAAKTVAAGHTFYLFLKNAFPINVLRALKQVPEVCSIYAATANPLQVVVAKSEQGRGIMGVIDGATPLNVEDEEGRAWRRDFLRKIGYKR